MLFSKHSNDVDFMQINKMIEEITTSYLGKNVDEIFLYKNNLIYIEYKSNELHRSYIVNYNGKLVYQNDDDIVSYLSKRKKDSNWIKEIYNAYKCYLNQKKIINDKLKKQQDRDEKTRKVLKIFELVYPDGYVDEMITIDNVKKLSSNRYYLYADGDYLVDDNFGGRIKYLDQVVVSERPLSIYNTGIWEDYVCNLVDELEIKENLDKHIKTRNLKGEN